MNRTDARALQIPPDGKIGYDEMALSMELSMPWLKLLPPASSIAWQWPRLEHIGQGCLA